MFEIKNASKSFNKSGVKAVDSLTLTVNNGEIFVRKCIFKPNLYMEI